jgi:hypothetical protein
MKEGLTLLVTKIIHLFLDFNYNDLMHERDTRIQIT